MFQGHVKKFQSIEDGTISVLLKVPADQVGKVTELYQQDVVVQPAQAELLPENKQEILHDIRSLLRAVVTKLEGI